MEGKNKSGLLQGNLQIVCVKTILQKAVRKQLFSCFKTCKNIVVRVFYRGWMTANKNSSRNFGLVGMKKRTCSNSLAIGWLLR